MIDQWWNWFGPMSLQVAVLGLAALLLDTSLRRWLWPQQRIWIWALCMAKLVLPPVLRSPVSVAEALPVVPPSPPSAGIAELAFAVWVVGALALGGLGWKRYQRQLERGLTGLHFELPAELRTDAIWCADLLEMESVPTLALDSRRRGPAVLGLRRPVVVLPADVVSRMGTEQRRHVLLHEFGHLKRRDPLWSTVCLALQILYWYHPVVWLAQRRLQTLREEACDALVARRTESPLQYRSTLIHVAAQVHELSPVGLPFVIPSSHLTARLRGLERFDPRHAWRRRIVAAAVLLLLAGCFAPLGRTVASKPLPGCLPLRLQVLSALAQQRAQNSEIPTPAPKEEVKP